MENQNNRGGRCENNTAMNCNNDPHNDRNWQGIVNERLESKKPIRTGKKKDEMAVNIKTYKNLPRSKSKNSFSLRVIEANDEGFSNQMKTGNSISMQISKQCVAQMPTLLINRCSPCYDRISDLPLMKILG